LVESSLNPLSAYLVVIPSDLRYLSGSYSYSRSDAEHYFGERERERREVKEVPELEAAEVQEILQS